MIPPQFLQFWNSSASSFRTSGFKSVVSLQNTNCGFTAVFIKIYYYFMVPSKCWIFISLHHFLICFFLHIVQERQELLVIHYELCMQWQLLIVLLHAGNVLITKQKYNYLVYTIRANAISSCQGLFHSRIWKFWHISLWSTCTSSWEHLQVNLHIITTTQISGFTSYLPLDDRF